MKKVYYKSTVAYYGQIFIWVLLVAIFLTLFLCAGDYSKGNFEFILVCILISETLVSLCVPLTMRRIVFTDNSVSVKCGFICIKKLYYEDIKYIKILRKMSGPHPISYVCFSKQPLDAERVDVLFDRQSVTNREDVIFCDYPQKDLKELLKNRFPAVFWFEDEFDV